MPARRVAQAPPRLLSACRAQRHLQSLSGGGQYNVLFLHAEQDWVQQCAQWERANRGEHRPPSCPCRILNIASESNDWASEHTSVLTCRKLPPPAGRLLDNCVNNTATVGDSLRVHNVDAQVGGVRRQPLARAPGQASPAKLRCACSHASSAALSCQLSTCK